ncbi:GntR family transcriptional regulator [Desulfobacter hydrogenophilus]|uniref:GntR family transcriptional regulator n=1 Tax=Desulfobacter hydrogenophilus TaxID=2291 RepID=A0A328FDR1_9BACT|nr:GntR family transcriptional regulator [Desulfobacter hydrogenophilus]NDY71345.1 GntR family transcriptional regulator [Desulfobacter hydrogenophilus]QBH12257.1 GntR family transcriptional regulator [Desulfobacter hydrogenophilus]RAM01233.1 GntR family transcriptional regulator [Desulfobacter hydrogenophilus]
MLNPDSPMPLYHQISEQLQSRIREGVYPPGHMIPSETVLAKSYGVGRPTVRQAMDILVQKGLIQRKRGAGTFVKKPSPQIDLFSLAGTSQAFSTKGVPTQKKVIAPLEKKTVAGDVANPFHGQPAFVMSRLTMARDEPVLLEDIFLDPDLFAGIGDMDLGDKSLSRVVSERFYLTPSDGTQQFQVETLNEQRAPLLGMSHLDPILVVRRLLNFPNAPGAVYSVLFCRTNQFAFTQTIQNKK